MIPIKKVYYSFIGNSVIDLENLNGDKATSYEKKMYRKIQTLEDQAINVSKNLVLKDTKAYKDQSEEKTSLCILCIQPVV